MYKVVSWQLFYCTLALYTEKIFL